MERQILCTGAFYTEALRDASRIYRDLSQCRPFYFEGGFLTYRSITSFLSESSVSRWAALSSGVSRLTNSLVHAYTHISDALLF